MIHVSPVMEHVPSQVASIAVFPVALTVTSIPKARTEAACVPLLCGSLRHGSDGSHLRGAPLALANVLFPLLSPLRPRQRRPTVIHDEGYHLALLQYARSHDSRSRFVVPWSRLATIVQNRQLRGDLNSAEPDIASRSKGRG